VEPFDGKVVVIGKIACLSTACRPRPSFGLTFRLE
jgi:hypothetical protein